MPKLGEAYVNIRANLKPLRTGLAMAKNVVSSAMKSISNIIRTVLRKTFDMLKKMAIAFAAGITASVYAFAKFEKQMANVSTMLDDHTMHYLPGYSKAIKELSVKFGESTETITRALYDILSASVEPKKAIDILTVSMKAAKAGMTDTSIAADAITTILNSYGYSAESASEISDILFAIVKRGKTTFGELAPVIGRVASTAAVANVSFEELGAAIATMTRAGIKTDVAITSLRGILLAFLKPSEEAIEIANKFGFELNTVTLKSLGLLGVLQKLKGATAEELAMIIPNVRGMAGFAAALKQVEKQASDLELMLSATGLTAKAFEKMINTISFQLNRLKQSFIILGVSIGEAIAPGINRITKAVMAGIESINDYIDNNKYTWMKWSEIIAEIIIYIKKVIWEFIKYMQKDWVGGLKFTFDIFLKLLKTSFVTAIKMSIAAGKAMYKGLREGFLGKPFSEREIEHMIGKVYKEKLAAAKPGELVLPPKMGMTPTPGAYGEYRREALERLEEQTLKNIIGDTFESIKTDWRKTLDDIAAATPPELAEPIKKLWEDLHNTLAEIDEKYKSKMIEGIEKAIEETLKEGAMPAGLIAGKGKEEKRFGFAGIREAWERMVSGMSPELKESKKQTRVLENGFGDVVKAVNAINLENVGTVVA